MAVFLVRTKAFEGQVEMADNTTDDLGWDEGIDWIADSRWIRQADTTVISDIYRALSALLLVLVVLTIYSDGLVRMVSDGEKHY
ncbi:hypothetical protein An18g03260 [Aspergillus niger]|uniref:Uncharacterized protein n=2 Tax=Aspergillus niger TaxID=5061 RepID=A2RAI4_ASPNC|nr:hypothetical protein An18g03260 [Aspergillus niger]CAK48710.1 hypothetical protein An18g03260 [Aspergillus niger]